MSSGKIDYDIATQLTNKLRDSIEVFRHSTPGVFGHSLHTSLVKEHSDKYSSDRDIAVWVLAFDGDVLVGTTAVFSRQVLYEGKNILLGGVGKVRVAVTHRKQGIARNMMEMAMRFMKKNGNEVAYLCTDTRSFLSDFYRSFGFVPLGKKYTYLGASGKRYYGEDGMIAPVISQDLFEHILQGKNPLDLGRGNW